MPTRSIRRRYTLCPEETERDLWAAGLREAERPEQDAVELEWAGDRAVILPGRTDIAFARNAEKGCRIGREYPATPLSALNAA